MRTAEAARDVLDLGSRWQHLADIVPSSVRVLHDQQRVRAESSARVKRKEVRRHRAPSSRLLGVAQFTEDTIKVMVMVVPM